MHYLGLIMALVFACASLGCRKLALEPRSTLDAASVYQDYTVNSFVSFSGTTATTSFSFEAVFHLGSKDGMGSSLPEGSTITCNGVALVKNFGSGTSVNYYLASTAAHPSAFDFVWTEADGTTHKNTVGYPSTSASFETPATTISRSAALQLHWSDSTPSSSTLNVGFSQPSGQFAAPTIVRGSVPTLQFSVTTMSALVVGSATLMTRTSVVSPLLAPTAAGGQVTYTDTANYPVSITN